MKTIEKVFATLDQAEDYQNGLYEQFATVKLIQCPLFSENGSYVWEVKE